MEERIEFNFAICDYQFLSIRLVVNFSRLIEEVKQLFGINKTLVNCAIYAAEVREREVEPV